ncbi:formate dehydrogenase accessory sulfurtransferase FdhD [Aeromicrobium halocynthiae]|uniref:Sulfur carrier protein FdhD n=1 Tax=Aeromicrobium halocynthiae TaxID=560557 RepID=A0ABN2W6Q2_9ACTN
MPSGTEVPTRRRITRFGPDGRQEVDDELAAESPLEIRVGGRGYAVTMRTPGHDVELAAGFLVSEGLVSASEDLPEVGVREDLEGDVVEAEVRGPGALVAMDRNRHVYTTSSCGVCGLASIDAVATTSRFDVSTDPVVLSVEAIGALPDRLRAEQAVFDSTGGVHAAGIFDASGASLVVREDVGRHNAVDKAVGWALLDGRLPLTGHVLQVSGRASFELVQKAAMAGIPVLAAVSAPSSLAVDLAERLGITLVGFSRRGAFNVYAGAERFG